MKKQYYAITTKMIFEKTVLVPVDSVEVKQLQIIKLSKETKNRR